MATNDENNEENFKKLNNDTLSIKERNVAYSELLAVSDYDKNGGRIFFNSGWIRNPSDK